MEILGRKIVVPKKVLGRKTIQNNKVMGRKIGLSSTNFNRSGSSQPPVPNLERR